MLHTWHKIPAVPQAETIERRWATVLETREAVNKAIEAVRMQGRIGPSLQAEVTIRAHGERYTALAALGEELKFALITSQVRLVEVDTPEAEGIEIEPSPHAKCERCWHYEADVGRDPEHPTLCARCIDNLHGAGETRRWA